VPVSAGSVRGGGVVATVAGVVGTGVGTDTGAGDVQPATRIPTNRTAQTKNGNDFILTEYHHILYIPILTLSLRARARIISSEISISGIVIVFRGSCNIPESLSYSVKLSKLFIL
jgi:hypothetical protein